MMMALRQSPTEQFLFQALDGSKPPRRLSRGAIVAIGASIVAHLGLVAYLATQHFVFQMQPSDNSSVTRMTTITLTPPKAIAPPTPTPQHSAVVDHVAKAPPTTLPAHKTVISQGTLQGVQLSSGLIGVTIYDIDPILTPCYKGA